MANIYFTNDNPIIETLESEYSVTITDQTRPENQYLINGYSYHRPMNIVEKVRNYVGYEEGIVKDIHYSFQNQGMQPIDYTLIYNYDDLPTADNYLTSGYFSWPHYSLENQVYTEYVYFPNYIPSNLMNIPIQYINGPNGLIADNDETIAYYGIDEFGDTTNKLGDIQHKTGEITVTNPYPNEINNGYNIDVNALESALSYVYGVEWDSNNPDPHIKRIGNMDLHKSLPIQSKMRRCCMWSDGIIAYYLDPNDSNKKADGAPSYLDGTHGAVMVELPSFYWKREVEGTVQRILLSTISLPGFTYSPVMYCSAYEAFNDTSRGVLHSVTNVLPTTNTSMVAFRTLARARNARWNVYTYDIHKIIASLYLVEYANFRSQEAWTDALTPEGFRQGGLSMGATNISPISTAPRFSTGFSNSWGNKTKAVLADSSNNWLFSYRGLENLYGNTTILMDGIVFVTPDASTVNIYKTSDPSLFDIPITDVRTKYEQIPGNFYGNNGYQKSLTPYEFISGGLGGSESTYITDYCTIYNGIRITKDHVTMGYNVDTRNYCGLFATSYAPDNYVTTQVGQRLTYYADPSTTSQTVYDPIEPTMVSLDTIHLTQTNSTGVIKGLTFKITQPCDYPWYLIWFNRFGGYSFLPILAKQESYNGTITSYLNKRLDETTERKVVLNKKPTKSHILHTDFMTDEMSEIMIADLYYSPKVWLFHNDGIRIEDFRKKSIEVNVSSNSIQIKQRDFDNLYTYQIQVEEIKPNIRPI